VRTKHARRQQWWKIVLCAVMPMLAWAGPVPPNDAVQAYIRANPTLVVGVYDSGWPPFEFLENGQMRGLGPQLLSQLATTLGMQVQYRRYPDWAHVLDAACRSEIDVVMNIAGEADAPRCMLYTRAYASSPLALVGRQGDLRASDDPDLTALRVVTEQGFLTGAQVRARFPAARQQTAPTTREALQRVADQQADVYIGNAHVASYLVHRQPMQGIGLLRPSDLPPEELRLGVPASKPALLDALEQALAALPNAQRAALGAQWLNAPVWSEPAREALSQAERRVLATPLKIGFAPNAAPLSFATADGQPSGLAGDYLQRLRGAGATLQPQTSHDWYDVREKMRSGRLDAVMGVPADSTYLGEDWVFSQPFLVVPNVIVTAARSGTVLQLGDLAGKRILLSDPDRLRSKVLQGAPQARIVPARSIEQALQRLQAGEADAYIGNLAAVERLLRERFPGQLQIIAPAGFNDALSLAVRRSHAPLATTFDRLLQQMGPREREALRNDWLAVDYPRGTDWRSVARWAVPLALILCTALLMYALGYWRLRREGQGRRRLEQRLEEVTDNLPAVVYQMHRHADGSVVFPYIAGDLRALFGIDKAEAMQSPQSLLDCIEPADRDAVRQAIEDAARGFLPLAFEFRTAPQGQTCWVRSQAQPYASDAGTVTWSGYWVEVTQAREQSDALLQAKAAAEEAVDAKARFLAVMSHEIRTPMSGVLGMLEILSSTRLQPPQRAQLEHAETSAQALSGMLDDILDYAKIDAGALRLEPLPLPLRPMLEALQLQYAGRARDKGLQLQLQVDPRLAAVHEVDGLRLRQVLGNLLGNAIGATRHGTVTLRVEVLEDGSSASLQQLRLLVLDTGEGMDAQQLQAALEPLLHSGPSLPRGMGGVGLGLSISLRLVQLMGGTLVVRSVAGSGTEVEVELPLPVASDDDLAAAEPGADAVPPLPAALRHAHVLVLEDHPVAQAMMAWRLERLGVQHTVVGDGRQGLQQVAAGPVDLVIADCHMPVMDGYVFTRLLREREGRTGGARLPVLALTASLLEEDRRRCRDAGMDEVLHKPLSLAALRACLLQWLARDEGQPPAPGAPR